MQAKIYVLGFVQGVGYRQFIKKKALGLNLKGYVKNLPDGRVEVVVQGAREEIEKFIKICEKGTFFSDVKSVQVEREEGQDKYSDFEIIR